MADNPKDGGAQGEPDGSLDNRVSKLETGQDSLSSQLNEVLSLLRGKGGDGESGGHAAEGSGGGIAAEISAQLAERDRQRAEEDRHADASNRLAAVETKLSEMAEHKPGPLPTRRSRIMWGHE